MKNRFRYVGMHIASAFIACCMTISMFVYPAFAGSLELVCGKEEHTHTDDCFKMKLVCSKEETEGHAHTAACYGERQILVCGKQEAEGDPGHKHGDGCFDADGNLICPLEEREPTEGHTHDDTCMGVEKYLICEVPETPAHRHDAKCYQRTGEPICGLPEHKHEDVCWSDHSKDLSSPEIWEKDFEELEYTGIWADDLLAVANTQKGRGESTRNYIMDSNGHIRGYTRYSQWWNNNVYAYYEHMTKDVLLMHLYDDWCANFVSFCLYYAKIPQEAVCWENGCRRWVEDFKDAGIYEDNWEVEYTPQPGDIVFLTFDRDRKADHVAIVSEVDVENSRIYTIEGNNGNIVKNAWYTYTSRTVLGYCNIRKAQALYMSTHAPELPEGKAVWNDRSGDVYIRPLPEKGQIHSGPTKILLE